ncbi:MAG: archaellin/type IV pilin N-terminal domain-containing protein [Candidatus Bathyarchaeia archaeon]
MGSLKFVENKKGLSPIFAVLILIAITVIAGIVVYMYSSGYLATMFGGGTTGQEKVAIQAITVDDSGKVTVYAKSVGGGDVTITDYIIKDASGNAKKVDSLGEEVVLDSDGSMKDITITGIDLGSGTYTVTLVSKNGNQFVSPSFKIS